VIVKSATASGADVHLSVQELRILNNAMNETLEAVDEQEFDTRVGASTDEVSALLDDVHNLLVELPAE
jgi:cell division septum initiation protein DivIVA